MPKRSGGSRPEPYNSAPARNEPSFSVRIEYVGVIAMACLALGLIIGSMYFGGGRQNARAAVDDLVAQGNAAYDARDPRAAIAAYEKALRIDPRNPDVLTDAGTMYLELKDIQKAIGYFQRAAGESPQHLNSRFNLGIALMSAKRYAEAATAFRECLTIEPTGKLAKAAKAHLDIVQKKLGKR